MNVDAAEIAKFSDIANNWWDPNSEFRALHDINPLRVKWIDDKAKLAGKTVLDVGCGGGILAEAMATLGAQVTGIDLSEKSLKTATWHLLESGQKVDYQLASAEDHAAAHPATYDVVTCLEMLEHVPDPASVVAACARLVKPGGWVFFSTLNRNPKSYAFAILGAEYILGLIPRGTHDWARFIKPAELARMARTAGLATDEFRGMTYNPVSKIYKLDTDTDVNYLLATRHDA